MREGSGFNWPVILGWLTDDDFSRFWVRCLWKHFGWVGYAYSTHTHKPVKWVHHGLGLGHMAAEQYFILQDNNEWKISFKDKHYGPYDSQLEAIEAAIDAAYAMGNIGIDAQVLVQDTDQKIRTAWSYGQDFYK